MDKKIADMNFDSGYINADTVKGYSEEKIEWLRGGGSVFSRYISLGFDGEEVALYTYKDGGLAWVTIYLKAIYADKSKNVKWEYYSVWNYDGEIIKEHKIGDFGDEENMIIEAEKSILEASERFEELEKE